MKKEAKKAKAAAPAKAPEPASVQRRPLGWLLSPASVMHHPPGVLLIDAIVFVALLLCTILLNKYLVFVNIVFFFVRVGSLVLLVLSVATLVYLLKLAAHLFHGIAQLRSPYKFVIFILVVIAAAFIFLRQDYFVPKLLGILRAIPWSNLNPFAVVII